MSQQSPPYPPRVWSLGGTPAKHVDVAVSAVFLVLFVIGAASHMTIFQVNRRRNHKFRLSLLLFGFCMARTVTCILRISSAALPTDIPLLIGAQIFAAAGVVILFVVNLVFTQRVLRATHPKIGWHPVTTAAFKFLYGWIIVTIAMVITVVVQSFYTRRPRTHTIDRAVQLYGLTCFAIISFLPIPIITAATLVARSNKLDKFGHGSWRYKVSMLLIGGVLVCFGACYRAGVNWLTPVPMTQRMPSALGKGPFYAVNFVVEIITVYLYAFSRVNKRFRVPDGAGVHKSYQRTATQMSDDASRSLSDDEEKTMALNSPPGTGKSKEDPSPR